MDSSRGYERDARAPEREVLRQLRRHRERQELRRERDRLLLDLETSLGRDGLGRAFGTSPAVAEALVERARRRLADARTEIEARRAARDPERWREADRMFEALGRSARVPPFLPPHEKH